MHEFLVKSRRATSERLPDLEGRGLVVASSKCAPSSSIDSSTAVFPFRGSGSLVHHLQSIYKAFDRFNLPDTVSTTRRVRVGVMSSGVVGKWIGWPGYVRRCALAPLVVPPFSPLFPSYLTPSPLISRFQSRSTASITSWSPSGPLTRRCCRDRLLYGLFHRILRLRQHSGGPGHSRRPLTPQVGPMTLQILYLDVVRPFHWRARY